MRTIFHSNRKSLNHRPYFIRVYEQNGIYRYVVHYSRDSRENYEGYEKKNYKPLYRINILPARSSTQ